MCLAGLKYIKDFPPVQRLYKGMNYFRKKRNIIRKTIPPGITLVTKCGKTMVFMRIRLVLGGRKMNRHRRQELPPLAVRFTASGGRTHASIA